MTQLKVSEHGRLALAAAVTEEAADEIVEEISPEFWRGADCSVTREPGGGWTLKAGNAVGITRTRITSGDVYVQVLPKLHTADMFFMADWAYEQRHDPLKLLAEDDVELAALLRDPTACLLVWHARAIRRFAARWLRRGYQTQSRVLSGKVKGKVLISRYVSGHLAVGDAANIPCRLQERTQDTPNNRVLKAGLRHIAALSHALPVPAARRAVLREANAALPLFGYVSDGPVTKSLLRSTSTRGPQRHYLSILDATIALLQNRLLSDEFGSSQTTSAFMWHMPTLFQEFVRGLLASSPAVTLIEGKPPSATIYDASDKRRRSSKVDPDLVARIGNGPVLLIDTKYKDVLPSGEKYFKYDSDEGGDGVDGNDKIVTPVDERHRIRVTRSDVYQAVAYRQHDKWPGSQSALLYPLVLAEGDVLPKPMEIRGFGDPISLLFIDIGRHASANLPAFFQALQHYAGEADALQVG